MWPILVLGILALGVIIERFRGLMMLNTRAEALRSRSASCSRPTASKKP